MDDTFRTAYVYKRDVFAGTLRETDDGYTFEYDGHYLTMPETVGVSLTLPKREEPYRSKTLFAFFDGLIPEGWLLSIVTQNWKIDPRDHFGIMLVACRDCIGAVNIQGEKR